jgi:hypothetical protein
VFSAFLFMYPQYSGAGYGSTAATLPADEAIE